jgi:heterodisulfide reductase subunit B
MRYLYYPGCSLKSTGRAYEESLLAVCQTLGVTLDELDDWNCCGATSYMAIDETKAFALAARNLALAEEQGKAGKETPAVDLVAPCAACYLVLSKAQHALEEDPATAAKITGALHAAQLAYHGRVVMRHPLDLFTNAIGLDAIKAKVTKPLAGLKVACYYGCQIVRPYATFDDQYNPMTMDNIVTALGGTPVEWPLKTRCCGGSLTGTVQEVGLRLGYNLLKEAGKRGADVVITACPLCQFNLECYQDPMKAAFPDHTPLPVLYFTQLMGLALGVNGARLGMQRLFVPFRAAVGV